MIELTRLFQGVALKRPAPDISVTGLTHDSRLVQPGDLFVALPGINSDGATFVQQAVAAGAAAVVGSAPDPGTLPHYLEVESPREALSRIAANYYSHPSRKLTVVGITGTNGKTTTAFLVAAILNAHNFRAAVMGTLGLRWAGSWKSTGFTTPEADQLHRSLANLVREDITALAMEVSSHGLEQHRVDDVDFDVAVFTNLTREHLDFHQDMEHYLAAKLKLFALLPADRPAIVNLDDPHASDFIQAAPGRTLTYSLDSEADLTVSDMGLGLQTTVANLSWQGETIAIESSLVGAYNLENLLAAVTTALALEVPVAAIQDGIRAVRIVPGRLERLTSAVPGNVYIDYAHTPDAYEKVLGTMRQLAPEGSAITTLFGCGGDRDRSKRPLMAAVAERYSDHLVITSDNPRTEKLARINADILSGLKAHKHVVIENRQAALLHALSQMSEESILIILGKGREDYEIIGTEQLPHDDVEIVESYGA